MIAWEAAINLTPVFTVLLYVAAIGTILFVLYLVGIFISNAFGSVSNVLHGKDDEFGSIILFWGAVAIVVALVVLAFTQGIVAFE